MSFDMHILLFLLLKAKIINVAKYSQKVANCRRSHFAFESQNNKCGQIQPKSQGHPMTIFGKYLFRR